MAGSVVPVPVDEALDLLDVLIAYDTVALTPNLDLISDVQDRLEALGASVVLTHDDSGTKANLFATIGPNINGGVVLSGHSDVVPADPTDWTTPPCTADRRNGRIYGRGTADMKGFVACVLAMAPIYAELDLTVPIHVALTFDEEDGFHGAPILLADLVERGVRPSAAIIGEPTGLRTVGAHKGCYEYRTMVTGMNGHSSAPAEAVSAVHHASRWISGLLGLADDLANRAPAPSPYAPPSTTVNGGTRRGGQGRGMRGRRPVLVRLGAAPRPGFGHFVRQGTYGGRRDRPARRDAGCVPRGLHPNRRGLRDRWLGVAGRLAGP